MCFANTFALAAQSQNNVQSQSNEMPFLIFANTHLTPPHTHTHINLRQRSRSQMKHDSIQLGDMKIAVRGFQFFPTTLPHFRAQGRESLIPFSFSAVHLSLIYSTKWWIFLLLASHIGSRNSSWNYRINEEILDWVASVVNATLKKLVYFQCACMDFIILIIYVIRRSGRCNRFTNWIVKLEECRDSHRIAVKMNQNQLHCVIYQKRRSDAHMPEFSRRLYEHSNNERTHGPDIFYLIWRFFRDSHKDIVSSPRVFFFHKSEISRSESILNECE